MTWPSGYLIHRSHVCSFLTITSCSCWTFRDYFSVIVRLHYISFPFHHRIELAECITLMEQGRDIFAVYGMLRYRFKTLESIRVENSMNLREQILLPDSSESLGDETEVSHVSRTQVAAHCMQ